jgi:AcrR family transcriptional regulator
VRAEGQMSPPTKSDTPSAASRPRRERGRNPVQTTKGQRTRTRLLNSAAQVFLKDGYLEARVADIAKGAKVAHGSFYTYFVSKEDVFGEVADRVVDSMYAALEVGVPGATSLERIHAANRRYLELYAEHAPFIALIEQVATFDERFRAMRLELRRRFVNRIERAIVGIYAREESALPGLDPHLLANALGGMVDNFSYVWFVLDEPFDRDAATHTLDTVWARALGLPAPAA